MKKYIASPLWASAPVLLAATTALSAWGAPLNGSWLSLQDMGAIEPAAGLERPETPANPYRLTQYDTPEGTFEASAEAPFGMATSQTYVTPLTPADLSDMMFQALERQDWHLADYYATQLSSSAATPEDGATAAYGRALALTQQERYTDALEALKPLEKASRVFRRAAGGLAATLHLQIAELALLDNNRALAAQHLASYDFYANTDSQPTRAARLKHKLNGQALPQNYVRIAVLLPLTGTHQKTGKNLLYAMQQALFTDEASKVVLYPLDTGSTADTIAATAAQIENLNVDAIVGPLLSPQVDALKKALPRTHPPVLALSSDPHVAAPNIHLIGYRPDQQARLIAQHAVSLGRTRFAALIPSTPYGYEVFDAFREEADALGATITATNFYNPETPDLSSALETLLHLDIARQNLREERDALQAEYAALGNALPDEKLNRLKALKKAKPEAVVDFDALFLPARANRLSLITSQMAVYDLDRQDVMILGTAAWDAPSLQRGSDYIRAGRFPALPDRQAFNTLFQNNFNQPASLLAAIGYDAVRMIADAAQQPGELAQNLLRPEGFAGASGPVRLMPHGLAERGYALKALAPGETVHVKQAPRLLPPSLPIPLNPAHISPIWHYL